MKKKVLVLLALVALLAAATMPAFADDQGIVSCTVTPKLISVMLSPGTHDYGAVALGGYKASTTAFTATNNGNVSEDFHIKGANAQESAADKWTLTTDDTLLASTDYYMHEFAKPSYPAEGTHWTALSTSYQSLAGSVAGSEAGSQDFKLQIWTPATSSTTAQLTAVVTVAATDVGGTP